MKSNVSDYLKLVEAIYIDATTKCTADVYDLRDLMTIRSRVKAEGISFLTITLPAFCRDFERSLANGHISPTSFARWKSAKDAKMPAFLQGILSLIFDRWTGKVNQNEIPPKLGGLSCDIPTLVDSVRQICLTFKKVELECTPKRIQSALDSFVSIEHSLSTFSLSEEDRSEFRIVSSMLWDNMVVDFSTSMVVPQHGPGATADKRLGNKKFYWRRWHDRLEPYFPLLGYAYPLGTHPESEEFKNVSIIPAELEQPVKVVTVPKTLKSPRIIAIEPCCVQYAQHGIQSYLYDKIEGNELSSGHVNFTDQSINRALAMSSSKTGLLATIDLSDASDRVPRDLALEMFSGSPDLRDAIDACRSTRAKLPDREEILDLKKFASMGSALCFPVQAMYFYTICVVALLKAQDLSYSRRNIYIVTRDLYVYGDDIIVPSANAVIVLDYLQKYNCKVNSNKTFVSGSFRESCGMDAYGGYEVTPTYITRELPENKRQSQSIISSVAAANSFYKKGYWRTSELIFARIERLVGPLPYVSENSEGLGRYSYLGLQTITRWSRRYHRFEVRALVPRSTYRTDKLDGYGALSKCLLLLEVQSEKFDRTSTSRKAHLEQSALLGAVALQRRWVTTS